MSYTLGRNEKSTTQIAILNEDAIITFAAVGILEDVHEACLTFPARARTPAHRA